MADSQTVCPFCNDSILIPEEFYGSEIQCPRCQKQFFLPKNVEVSESAEGMDNEIVGTFVCPLCGNENELPEDFSGKVDCQFCHNEVDVINEDVRQCPHCGKNISKNDTTCIYCQRKIDEPVTLRKEESKVVQSEFSGDSEDHAVLRLLKKLKILNVVVFGLAFLLCIALIVMAIIASRGEFTISVRTFISQCLFAIGALCYVTLIFHAILCWGKGIYKNVLGIRNAAEKKSGSTEE